MRFIWADFLPPTPAYTKINPNISNFYQGQLYTSTAVTPSRGKDVSRPPYAKTTAHNIHWAKSFSQINKTLVCTFNVCFHMHSFISSVLMNKNETRRILRLIMIKIVVLLSIILTSSVNCFYLKLLRDGTLTLTALRHQGTKLPEVFFCNYRFTSIQLSAVSPNIFFFFSVKIFLLKLAVNRILVTLTK